MPFKQLLLLGLLVLGSVCAAGCDDKIKVSDEDIKQLRETVKLRDMMGSKKKPTVVVDPRTAKRYNEGHIDGAINIPLAQLVAEEPQLANAHSIVVYGTLITDRTSPAAAKKLMALGYKNVYDYRGGLDQWRNDGGRVIVTAPPETQPASAKP